MRIAKSPSNVARLLIFDYVGAGFSGADALGLLGTVWTVLGRVFDQYTCTRGALPAQWGTSWEQVSPEKIALGYQIRSGQVDGKDVPEVLDDDTEWDPDDPADSMVQHFLSVITNEAAANNWCSVFIELLRSFCLQYWVPPALINLTDEQRRLLAESVQGDLSEHRFTDEFLNTDYGLYALAEQVAQMEQDGDPIDTRPSGPTIDQRLGLLEEKINQIAPAAEEKTLTDNDIRLSFAELQRRIEYLTSLVQDNQGAN